MNPEKLLEETGGFRDRGRESRSKSRGPSTEGWVGGVRQPVKNAEKSEESSIGRGRRRLRVVLTDELKKDGNGVMGEKGPSASFVDITYTEKS